MKKLLTLIFCFVTFIVGVFSQNFTLDWFINNEPAPNINSGTSAVVHDQNGNIYSTSWVTSGQDIDYGLPYTVAPVTGLMIAKYSVNGELIWSKFVAELNGADIALGSDGVLYFVFHP